MEQPKTVRIGIRVSPELHKMIQDVATRERRKMSDMARLMIEEAVEQYVEEDKATYCNAPGGLENLGGGLDIFQSR